MQRSGQESFFVGRVSYPHNCFTLDLTNNSELTENGLERIWFEFKNLTATNSLVEIHMQGYNLASTAEGLYSSTEAIRLNKKNHRKYAIKLTQRVFVESDAVKDCRNYPKKRAPPDFVLNSSSQLHAPPGFRFCC